MDRPPPIPPDPASPPGAPALPDQPPATRGRRVAPVIIAVAAIVMVAIVTVPLLVLFLGRDSKPDVKAGWKREAPGGQGFIVYLPPNWNSVSTKSADDAFNSLKAANPELANLVRDQLGSSLGSLIKLLAFDVQSPTLGRQFATNLNVVVAPAADASFDEFVNLNVAQLRRTPGLGSLRDEKVALPAGQAAKVSSQLTVNAPGGQQTVAITQYLLLNEGRGYIISFSTLPSHVGSYSSLFLEIAETFRFV